MPYGRFHPTLILIAGLLSASGALAAPSRPKAVISAAECRALMAGPAPVPGAAYVPGVDVNGQPVAPVDVGGTPPPLGDIVIDLRTLLGQVSGGTVPPILSASEIREGRIRIGLDNGEVSLNGHPLGPQATAAARAACSKAKRR
jgi:hypothetical protein